MARGKSHPEETKELARARVSAGESKSKVARDLGVALSTLSGWLGQAVNDSHQESRDNRKLQFIKKAWDVIDQALELSSQKIKLATVASDQFQELIDRLIQLMEEREDVKGKDVKDIILALGKVMNIGLTEISTFTGTIYDKQSKASGEEDARFVFEIKGEGDYGVIAQALEGLSEDAKREVIDSIKRIRGEVNPVQH